MYALLEKYIFPAQFIQAVTKEAITQILVEKCRSAFGEPQAQQLVDLCRQQLVRPVGQEVIQLRIRQLCEDILTNQRRQKAFLKTGYGLIQDRPETKLLYGAIGAGLSNTLALVSEIVDVSRFPDGEHLASFLGITTSKHISGTTIFHSKHITKQGSSNGRYAIVNLAQHLCRKVPKYQEMYQRIKARKPARIGYIIAVVAVARDFATHILFDMWRNQRPFFLEVADYRQYRQQHPHTTT